MIKSNVIKIKDKYYTFKYSTVKNKISDAVHSIFYNYAIDPIGVCRLYTETNEQLNDSELEDLSSTYKLFNNTDPYFESQNINIEDDTMGEELDSQTMMDLLAEVF